MIGLMRRRAMGKVILPYDAEVEFLEGTGTQWIDTGIVPTLNKTIRCQFEVLYRNVQTRQIMGRQGSVYFGAVNGKLQIISGSTTTTNITLQTDKWYAGDVSFPIPNASNINMTATYTWGESTGTSTNKYADTPSNGTFWLFCCNNADTLRGSNALKYFKLWQGGELVRDFIPVRKDGVGYMYDKVSRTLFGNAGTGSFVIGPDKGMLYNTEVEYLEFDGNQYIDTLITADNTIEAEVDVVVTNTQGSTGLLSSRASTNYNTGSQSDLSLSIWTNGSKIALNDKNYDSGWENGITNGIRFVASIKERKLYVDNTLIATSSSTTSYSYDVSYGLLRGHYANGNWDTRKGVSGKLYACKIWKNNALVYDVIPVRVGQTGYMYDKISGKLFGNSGTGSFVIGPDNVLPYDAEVEWLQSDGSAYLDTGIKAAGNLYIKTYLVDYFVNDNGGKWAFGGRTSSNSGMFGLFINNNSKLVFMGYNTSSGTLGFNTCTSYPQSAVVEIGDGNVKIGSTSHTYTKATFTSTQNVILFGLNNGGSQIVAGLKIGPTYLTDGTNTVDLIPVRKDGVGYMYDKVSGQLFGNAGTGDFILGNDV